MRVIPQLLRSGRYVRPSLGISVDEQVNSQLKALTGRDGVFVLAVEPGSAAAKAGIVGVTTGPGGLVPGDIITTVNGKPVDTIGALLARLDDFKVGAHVRVTLQRGQTTREVTMALQPGE